MKSHLEDDLINLIEGTISRLAGKEVLTSARAYEIVYDAARDRILVADKNNQNPLSTLFAVHKELKPFYHRVRSIVARQLIGLTYDHTKQAVIDACEVFLGRQDLTIAPKPTLAFTGYCDTFSIWNLYCNGTDARRNVNEKSCDRALLYRLDQSIELLGFILNGEVRVSDVIASAFNGTLTEPEARPAKSWGDPEFTQQAA